MVEIQIELCDFCGTCVGVCPEDAILLAEAALEIDSERCISCGDCADICPMGVLEVQS